MSLLKFAFALLSISSRLASAGIPPDAACAASLASIFFFSRKR